MSMAIVMTPPANLKSLARSKQASLPQTLQKKKKKISLIIHINNNELLKPHISVLPPI